MDLVELKQNRDRVFQDIAHACQKAERSVESVCLIWVSKTKPVSAVEAACELGAVDFGENRIQEALDKFSEERPGVKCHIIGPVQSNKLKKAAQVAHWIHSISSQKALDKLNKYAQECNKTIQVLFQVNTSGEDSKSGLQPEELESFLNSLSGHSNLLYSGLMTIGPNTGVAEDSRSGFAWLRKIRDQYLGKPHFEAFNELSMGMSGDLEVAISEGATMVRIGTALFGDRNYGV